MTENESELIAPHYALPICEESDNERLEYD